jgi:hypothetical protein
MTKMEFYDKMYKIAVESGDLPIDANTENCAAYTYGEMIEMLADKMDFPIDMLKYINWDKLLGDYCYENPICVVQYNNETDEYEAISPFNFDHETNMMFVEFTEQ